MATFRLVEAYSDTYQLVEDPDGIRILVLHDTQIPLKVWVQAHAGGAAAIWCSKTSQWMFTETFIENRQEFSTGFSVMIGWHSAAKMPTYREMRTPTEDDSRFSKFVHLHAHSEFSALDGLASVKEMVKQATDDNNGFLAVTDHGTCAAHPHLQEACQAAGIKPIFGIEAYFVDDRLERPKPKDQYESQEEANAEASRIRDYSHMTLWAMNETGLRNLWAMSTEAHRSGFYYHPRMDWEVLERFSEGVMASTGCLRGPMAKLLLEGRKEEAFLKTARFMDIFEDRFYVEIHTNQLQEQMQLNRELLNLAGPLKLPTIACVDSHYACYSEKAAHQVWIAAQTNKDLTEDADLFAGENDYHMAQERDVRQALRYLGEEAVETAVTNTYKLAKRCTAKIEGKTATPVMSKGGTFEENQKRDVQRVTEMCIARWPHKVSGNIKPFEEYQARFEREMKLLVDKGFCGYFLMVADYCKWARDHGILVGPGRGSGGGSLVAYLMDITEIDPVDADLLFERFLTEGRVSLPDFDVDFPASKRKDLEGYIREKYGADHVVRVGTHIRLKNKGCVRDLARVLKNTMEIDYRDIEAVSKLIDAAEADKAGLGMSWEDLWAQHGEELQPYRDKYPKLFEYADIIVGRLKSYGRHAAGVVISNDEPLIDRLPLRAGEDGEMIAEWDLEALESVGLVKFDLLTLRTLDTIQTTVDLIKEQLGETVNVYDWKDEYEDPMVWEQLSQGRTLGVFQIETRSGTRMTKDFKPQSLHDLADVITLVRPGPMRSGLTTIYMRRRAGEEEVSFPDPRLEEVLSKTQGCILYQEAVMQTTMVLAGYDSNEADAVRKILGKKKIDKVAAAGKQFISASIRNGMEPKAAEFLWSQMAEFAKYSFNLAHAYGYAVLGYWCAWLKFKYPLQFLAAALSTVDAERIPEFVNEARRMGYKVLPPDINDSGRGFKATDEGVRYGLDAVKNVGNKAVEIITENQPYESFEDFRERGAKGACNSGTVKTLAKVGAFDKLYPNRKELEHTLDWETSSDSKLCAHTDVNAIHPHGLPCGFDWESEPVELTAKGKEKKRKPPPKRCSKACRQYVAPTLELDVANYTEAEVRDREMELLGVHLSSTPFDRIPAESLAQCSLPEDIEAGRDGNYTIAAIVTKARPWQARDGREMGFAGLFAQTEDLDVVVFHDQWTKYRRDLIVGRLCLAVVRKTERGLNLVVMQPL